MRADINIQNQVQIENITQRTVSIIGGKGSGKTTTLKLFMGLFKPILVFDPIGVFNYPNAIRVTISKSTIPLGSDVAIKINFAIGAKQNVIISFQNLLQVEINAFLNDLFPALRIKDCIVAFDETHEFVPQVGFSSSEVERYIRHCRNYNVGIILTSLRPAAVNKNILALTDYLILYRLTWSHDLKAMRDLLAVRVGDKRAKSLLSSIQSLKFLEGLKIDFLTPSEPNRTRSEPDRLDDDLTKM